MTRTSPCGWGQIPITTEPPIRCDGCERQLTPEQDYQIDGRGTYCVDCAQRIEERRPAPPRMTTGELLGAAAILALSGGIAFEAVKGLWQAIQWGLQWLR